MKCNCGCGTTARWRVFQFPHGGAAYGDGEPCCDRAEKYLASVAAEMGFTHRSRPFDPPVPVQTVTKANIRRYLGAGYDLENVSIEQYVHRRRHLLRVEFMVSTDRPFEVFGPVAVKPKRRKRK